MTTLFRLTALGRSSRPTISRTKVWRAGLSNMFTNPSSRASRKTCHRRTAPTAVSEAQDERQHPGRRLGGEQEAALVDPVGDEPAPGPEQQHGQELQGRDDPEVEPRAPRWSQVQHEPGLGHASASRSR